MEELNSAQTRAIKKINEQASAFLNDRKQANNVLDILMKLKEEDEDIVIAAIDALELVFTSLIKTDEVSLEDKSSKTSDKVSTKKITLWLNEIYTSVKEELVFLFQRTSDIIVIRALSTAFKFIEDEGSKDEHSFPSNFLEAIIEGLLNSDGIIENAAMKNVISKFQSYIQYNDIKVYTLKSLKNILKKAIVNPIEEPTDNYLHNCFTLMKYINFESYDEAGENRLCKFEVSKRVFKLSEAKKIFRSMWMIFLKAKLPNKLYRRVLYALDDKVIPYMDSPLLLTDFLMDSYNKGGVCSILALNGIFVLMLKYNLEFPDFYKNLYALFRPHILNTKYRARFFYLSDIFLSSTHLPEYLMAAFIKRISRLTLTAPTPCLLLLLRFIRNLLTRHRNLAKMINDQKCKIELKTDPYDMNECDPAQCKALNSSLWEIKDLQNHYNPDVAIAAKCIDKPLPPVENDISNLLEISMDDMLKKENKRWHHAKEIPLNYKKLKINSYEEFMGPFWKINCLNKLESNLL